MRDKETIAVFFDSRPAIPRPSANSVLREAVGIDERFEVFFDGIAGGVGELDDLADRETAMFLREFENPDRQFG